jgi:tetratricopeptide (TPR) repeat protein
MSKKGTIKFSGKTGIRTVLMSLLFCVASAQQPVVYSNPKSKAIKLYEESQKYVNVDPQKTIGTLLKAIEKDSNFIEAHCFLAENYAYDGQKENAVSEYNKAFKINPNFFQANYFFAAKLELRLGHYQDAKAHADKYLASQSVSHQSDDEAILISKSCVFALDAMAHPVPFNPVNIGPEINTEYYEYFPTITADDQTLLFTRWLPVVRSENQHKSFQEDLFYSTKVNGKWTTAQSIGPMINTEGNEGAPCLSVDGQYLFFVACQEMYGYGLDRQGYGS